MWPSVETRPVCFDSWIFCFDNWIFTLLSFGSNYVALIFESYGAKLKPMMSPPWKFWDVFIDFGWGDRNYFECRRYYWFPMEMHFWLPERKFFRQIYDLTHSQTLSIAFKFCTGIFWLSENQFQQGFTTFSSVFIHCFTVSHPVTSFPFVSVFRSGPGSVKLLHLEKVFSLNHEKELHHC